MSGSASLGLRSGFYGSLASAGGRKTGARGWGWRGEEERLLLLHRALRLVGRRRAGMLLLLLAVASAAVFCSRLAVVKVLDNLFGLWRPQHLVIKFVLLLGKVKCQNLCGDQNHIFYERFLWRKNATFAISRQYKRFDVFDEAEANKDAGKYDNASIDYQIEFYRNEVLTHYSPAKIPVTSDVPEGCVIIREHIPVTNLFTCLWFNEVDRFTSRDQISFSTVQDKIRAKVGCMPQMFLDCERCSFVVQAYHRELLEQMIASGRKPPSTTGEPSRKLGPGSRKAPPSKKPSVKRRKEKKSSSRRRSPKPITGAMGVM